MPSHDPRVFMSLRSSNEPPSYLARQGKPGLHAAIAQAREEARDPDAGLSLLPRVIELSGATFADALHAIDRSRRPRTDEEQALDALPLRDRQLHDLAHPPQRRTADAAPDGMRRVEVPDSVRAQVVEVERLRRLKDATGW